MKRGGLGWLLTSVFIIVLVLGVIGPAFAAGPNDVPLDRTAIFRTHVAHFNSSSGGGGSGGGGTTSPSTAFSGAPYSVGSTITVTSSAPEAEEHIAIDPNNANNMVAAISDFALRGGYNTTKYAVSVDGGTIWAESYVPLDGSSYPLTSDGNSWEANSDPVVAVDKLGNMYLADLYFNGSNNANGLYVGVGGLSAGSIAAATTYPVVPPNLSPTTDVFEDKEWIALDNSSAATAGNAYLSWTHFVGNSDYIVLSRSSDHGQTWSASLRISPAAYDGAVQGSQVAVGPGGEVYVMYQVYYVGGQGKQFLAKSTDGGLTFSTPVAVTPLYKRVSFNSTYRKDSFASLAVSSGGTNSGYVYAVYPAQTSGGGAEVMFIRSTAAGATTFTSPVVINDKSSGQQFMPSVAVDSSGVIHSSWFDTRNSSKTSRYYDIYATYSANNGASFAPNARVTATKIDAGSSSFIGDYAGVAAGSDGKAHAVWTNGGFNGGRLQTVTLTP